MTSAAIPTYAELSAYSIDELSKLVIKDGVIVMEVAKALYEKLSKTEENEKPQLKRKRDRLTYNPDNWMNSCW